MSGEDRKGKRMPSTWKFWQLGLGRKAQRSRERRTLRRNYSLDRREEEDAMEILEAYKKTKTQEKDRFTIEEMGLKEKQRKLKEEPEELKKKIRKVRGNREEELFEILTHQVKVKATHQGELSFNGNQCKRILERSHEIIQVFKEGEEDRKEKWKILLEKLEKAGKILFQITPFQAVGLTKEEE